MTAVRLVPLLVLCIVATMPTPGSAAGTMEETLAPDGRPLDAASARSSSGADIFHYRAHACISAATNCGPDSVVPAASFAVYIDFSVPATQDYTRYYLVTDVEGKLVAFGQNTSTLTGGTRNTAAAGASGLAAGFYRFLSIITGADGLLSVSNQYQFRAQ